MSSNLSPDQQEYAADLLARRRNRNELRLENYEDGGVERELSSFFSGIATEQQSIGVLEVGVGDREVAREAFAGATTYYQRSAEEDPFPLQSSRQRMQGMYTALLAGDGIALAGLADSMLSLADTEDCTPGEHNADRYFLAWCLAGAVRGAVAEEALAGLETVNDSKPDPHADYGQAVLLVARGLRDDDPVLLRSGIESMLSFHEQDTAPDDVVGQVMSVQATASLVLARVQGYDISVESPFLAGEPVEQAVDSLSL